MVEAAKFAINTISASIIVKLHGSKLGAVKRGKGYTVKMISKMVGLSTFTVAKVIR